MALTNSNVSVVLHFVFDNVVRLCTEFSSLLCKVVEGSMPAISSADYLIPQRLKRAVRVRTFKDHVTSNILDSQVTDNSRCFRIPPLKSDSDSDILSS